MAFELIKKGWHLPKFAKPHVTVRRKGMTLNRGARELMGSPTKAHVYFDRKAGKIGVSPTTDEEGRVVSSSGGITMNMGDMFKDDEVTMVLCEPRMEGEMLVVDIPK